MSRVPSTQALRALESFARHGTVWQAADKLNLTRSAVSHQLRLLERDLGFRLMSRAGTRVELTPQGRAYAADVRRALSVLAGSAARQTGRGATGALTVSCTPGFGSSWLCPKLGRFRDRCPDVALSLVTPRRLGDTANPDADLFIAFCHPGSHADMEVELLKKVHFTPLCSPALLNRLGGLPEPRDLLAVNLLHLTDHEDWVTWFRLAGLPEEAARTGQRFSDMNLVHAATLASQGVGMGDEFICQQFMADGTLVRPFDLAIESPRAYYLAVSPQKAANPAVIAFRDWMADELPMG